MNVPADPGPEGRAARPPRGHRAAGADPPARAKRNGLPVPEGVFESDDEFAWTDFLHFLRTYDLAASVIRTPEDYRDVTFEYLSSCAAEGAIYVEVIASPDHAAAVGLSDADHYAGIAQGIDDARAAHGIEARIVIAAVRNLGVEAAEAIARRHAEDRHPYVVGFNLVGDEAAWPASLFARAYEIAAGSGLGCSVHAGEHAGPGVDPRRARAADHAHVARRARDRGARAGGRAGRPRHRARGVSELERGARRLPDLRRPSARCAPGGRGAGHARL